MSQKYGVRNLARRVRKPAIEVVNRASNMVGPPELKLLGYAPGLPPKQYWPKGFHPNGVSAWFDKWWTYDPKSRGELGWAIFPLRRVDVTDLAWWHDLWYWLGYFVPWDTPLPELKKLKPRPRSQRNWVQRRAADRHFRVGLRYLGLPRWRAKAAWKLLQRYGGRNYMFGGPEWTHEC